MTNAQQPKTRQLLPANQPLSSSCLAPTIVAKAPFARNLSEYDQYAFLSFQREIAGSLAKISPSPKWIQLALQLSFEQAPIFYGITAVTSVYRAMIQGCHPCKGLLLDDAKVDVAIVQYSKAVGALHRYIDDALRHGGNVEPILIACSLFICFEMMQGRGDLAISHLRLGQRIGREALQPTSLSRDPLAAPLTAASIATTKGILMMFDHIGQDTVENFTQPSDSIGYGPSRTIGDSSPTSASMPASFQSLEEARHHLNILARAQFDVRQELLEGAKECLTLDRQCTSHWATDYCLQHSLSRVVTPRQKVATQKRIEELIEGHKTWRLALDKILKATYGNSKLLLWMRIAHFYSSYIIGTCREARESLSDALLDEFAEIVDVLERYLALDTTATTPDQQISRPKVQVPRSFTMDYGVLPTLYLIALKCRDSTLRRRCIEILRESNRREDIDNDDVRHVFAQRVADLETEGIAVVRPELPASSDASAQDYIPEHARFLEVVIAGPDGSPRMQMVCSRFAHERNGELELLHFEGPEPRLPPGKMQLVRRTVYHYTANLSRHQLPEVES